SLAKKGIPKRPGGFQRALRFAADLFPRADPAKINVGKVLSRFLQHDDCVFRQCGHGAQEKPVCPISSIETGNEHVGELSFAACGFLQTPPIDLAWKNKIALFE